MQENHKILDKLYLNPIIEANSHRKILHPIKQKELSHEEYLVEYYKLLIMCGNSI